MQICISVADLNSLNFKDNMMRLYDTHFHLDLQKNVKAAIEEINANKIYTIAMTNLPVLYEKKSSNMTVHIYEQRWGFIPN